MVGHFWKLALLLVSFTCSSSLGADSTSGPEAETIRAEYLPTSDINNSPLIKLNDFVPTNQVNISTEPLAKGLKVDLARATDSKEAITIGPEAKTNNVENLPTSNINNSLLNDFATTDQVNTLTEPLAKGVKVDLASAAISKVTAKQDTNTGLTTQEEPLNITASTTSLVPTKDSKEVPVKETIGGVTSPVATSTSTADVTITSTISKDPSPSNYSLRPVIDHIPTTKDLPDTSHENDKTKDHETTSSHPSGETPKIPIQEDTQAPKTTPVTSQKQDDKAKKHKLVILILVLIVILILVLVAVVVIMVRNKRRRGSQSFHSQKRSSKKQDVWAGQVPELGDGKVMQNPIGVENGTAGNKVEPGKEQEMVTFISSDKKDDSVVEINELGKGDTMEEEQPLLEDSSQVTGEAEKTPVEEQIPAQTMQQIQV